MENVGLNMENVKGYNRALIMQLICTNNGVMRNFLTQASHLTPMTLTNITSELIKKNIICEIDLNSTEKSIGRTPKLLYPSPNSPVVAGIYMSRDYLYGIITDLSLNIIFQKKICFSSSENVQSISDKLIALSQYLVNNSNRQLLGLGISTIGVVNSLNGKITYVMDFFDINELDIQSLIEPYVNVPVFVKNDMQSTALCEMYFGLGKTKDHFIYVGLTNGIGSAIVANKQLLNNLTGSCGELGHTTVNHRGELCKCGNHGCLELSASVPRIIQHINEVCSTSFSNFEDAIAFSTQNETANKIMEEVADQLAFALNNLINIVDISTVIFGHYGVHLPDSMLNHISECINKISLFRHNRVITIGKSQFDETNAMLGSACIVLDQLFSGKLSFEN